jgi:hypothetical protein
MTDHQLSTRALAQARYLGADAALAAASWVVMSENDAKSILEDVDPMVLDNYREPDLSGEWGDDSTRDSLTFEVTGLSLQADRDVIADAIAGAWEEGRDLVWSDALDAVALRTLGHVEAALTLERDNERRVAQLHEGGNDERSYTS